MNGIFEKLYDMTAFSNIVAEPQFLVMYVIAFVLLYLGIKKQYEPLLLVPIAFGVLLANFPGGGMGVIQADENGMILVNGVMKNIWEMPLHDIGTDELCVLYAYKDRVPSPDHFYGSGGLDGLRTDASQSASVYIRGCRSIGYLYCVVGSYPDGIYTQ